MSCFGWLFPCHGTFSSNSDLSETSEPLLGQDGELDESVAYSEVDMSNQSQGEQVNTSLLTSMHEQVASIERHTIPPPQENDERHRRWEQILNEFQEKFEQIKMKYSDPPNYGAGQSVKGLGSMFPSVYQPNSKPDFGRRTSSYCPCSCGRNSCHYLFEWKGLYFCEVKLNETIDSELRCIPCRLDFDPKNCSNFVKKLGLLGVAEVVFPEKTGLTLEELDATLQGGMNSLILAKDYVGLLFLGYSNTDVRHSVLMINKRDPTDERVRMQIYDPQANDWWLNADQNVAFVDKISVVKLNAKVAEKWIPSCGRESCCREFSPPWSIQEEGNPKST